jgi:Spy/CpxP family protein refolding chaperone
MTGSAARIRLLGAAVLLAVFIAGVAVGTALDRVAGPGRVIKLYGSDMSGVLDKLDLTPRQRAAAEALIQRRAPRTETMILELGEHLRLIADSLDAELRTLLTPDQRARLDSLGAGRKLLLKRRVTGPGGASVTDTIFPPERRP